MYCPEHVVASWNPDRKGSLQRITFSWCILNNIPTCIYVSKLGNRTPSPHHSPLLLLPNVPFEIPVSCSSPASIVLWSRIHYFISLFLPCRLHNCKVPELHTGSSIFGFRHVQFPDRMRFGPLRPVEYCYLRQSPIPFDSQVTDFPNITYPEYTKFDVRLRERLSTRYNRLEPRI